MTTTDRLLAYACAYLAKDPDPITRARDILNWAHNAERLALAEQQAEEDDAPDGPTPAMQAAIKVHAELCRTGIPRQADPSFEGSRKRAHEAAGMAYADQFGSWSYGTTVQGIRVMVMVNAALDAFIAAMPPQHVQKMHELESPGPQPAEVPATLLSEDDRIALWHLIFDWQRRTPTSGKGDAGRAVDDFVKGLVFAARDQVRGHAPQPEEVPEDIFEAAYLTWEETSWHEREDHRAAFAVVWSAARRYGPMPPKVTPALCNEFWEAIHSLNGGDIPEETVRIGLEAVFASPTQQMGE